jgi:endogenous inhibitor of DNA gyrase (YacG/DUF329 family)
MPTDTIELSLNGKGLLCLRNHRFDSSGTDLGGSLYMAPECASWLSEAIRGFLSDRKPRRNRIGQDDLELKFSGPDYSPLLAIYNRRDASAVQGGIGVQSMQLELGPGLASQLDSLASSGTNSGDLDWLYARECPQCGEQAGWTGQTEEVWDDVALIMQCPSCRNEFNWASGALQADLRARPPVYRPGRGR